MEGINMKFCDECGGILIPKKDGEGFVCRNCGKEYKEEEGGEMRITEKGKETEDEVIDVQDEESSQLPVTEKKCEECGNNKAYWWMSQTRSGDEPATRFFKCTECGHTWREYD